LISKYILYIHLCSWIIVEYVFLSQSMTEEGIYDRRET
jgi:hypothetical protein